MDVKSLYIIKRDTGICMYHKDFTESVFDPHLISSFMVAMTSFFDEATHSITSRARAFEGTDYRIIVEFGEWTLGALSVRQETEHIRDKLRALIAKFEEQFNLLRWVDLDLAVYSRFELSVIDELLRDQIDEDSVIRLKLNWDLLTKNPDVKSFLRLLPDRCSVREAAEFLEMPVEVALNLVAKAVWEKAISVSRPVRLDDIYQTTSLLDLGGGHEGVSEETARAMSELNGETPLSIAAEKIKTADLRKFLDEIAVLAEQQAVERVPTSQMFLVLYTSAIRELMYRCSRIIGYNITRKVFEDSKKELLGPYSWLVLVDLKEGVDLEIRSSLTAATIKGKISPTHLSDGFRALLQFITKRLSYYMGKDPVNSVLKNARSSVEKQFPTLNYEIEWEQISAI